MVVALALMVVPTSAMAQEIATKRDREKERDGLIGRVLHLMPPRFAAELRLTAEQRSQIQKLEQEFKAKRIESLMRTVARVMAIVESLDADEADKEPAPVLALAHEVTGGLLESRRTRMKYEKEMLTLLNPEQQVKFAHLKELRPRDRREHAAHRMDGTTTFHFYYSAQGQEKLQLTDEQKRQFRELQKEIETRLRALLTEDQRRIFDETSRPQEKTPVPKRLRSKEPNEKQDK